MRGHHHSRASLIVEDGKGRDESLARLVPKGLDLGRDLGLLGRAPLQEPTRHDTATTATGSQVGTDAEQPGGDILRFATSSVLLHEAEEGLLDEIVGRVRVACEPVREAREAALVLVIGGHHEVGAAIRVRDDAKTSDHRAAVVGRVDSVLLQLGDALRGGLWQVAVVAG